MDIFLYIYTSSSKFSQNLVSTHKKNFLYLKNIISWKYSLIVGKYLFILRILFYSFEDSISSIWIFHTISWNEKIFLVSKLNKLFFSQKIQFFIWIWMKKQIEYRRECAALFWKIIQIYILNISFPNSLISIRNHEIFRK